MATRKTDSEPADGLHDAVEKPVKVDPSYVDRPYKDAMTDEQKTALEDAGLL